MVTHENERGGGVEWPQVPQAIGWLLVLGTAVWLSLQVAWTTIESRDRFTKSKPAGIEDIAGPDGLVDVPVEGLARDSADMMFLVVSAVNAAQKGVKRGVTIDVERVAQKFSLILGEAPTATTEDDMRELLELARERGLVLWGRRRGYQLTLEGRRVIDERSE